MPLHDYKCASCGHISEELVEWNEYTTHCHICGGTCDRIYRSFNGIKHTAPDWMKSVIEVVDKEGGSHCQEFIKHPTRNNYNNWMKGEGLRPMDQGESIKRKKVDTSGIRKKVKDKFRERNTITVRR